MGRGRIRIECHRLQANGQGNRGDYKECLIQMKLARRKSRGQVVIAELVVALAGRKARPIQYARTLRSLLFCNMTTMTQYHLVSSICLRRLMHMSACGWKSV